MIQQPEEFSIYKEAILSIHPECSEDEWEYLESGLSIQHFKSKEMYMEAGKKNHQLGFLTSGLVRAYYINDKGNEITILFAKENEYVTDYPSLLNQIPSRYYFQCLEPSTIITLPYEHMQNGYKKFSGFERYGRLMAEEILKMLQSRVESFQFDQAEQRYIQFIKQNPELFNRIPLTHLSSYLGIERPSLSRIRKKIAGL